MPDLNAVPVQSVRCNGHVAIQQARSDEQLNCSSTTCACRASHWPAYHGNGLNDFDENILKLLLLLLLSERLPSYSWLTTPWLHRVSTRSSAIAEGPRDASCQLKSCQLPRNSAETPCATSPEQIEVMKLEGYSGPMCNKHVHSIITRSSRFHCLIGVINKPTTDRVVDITCIPTTCCGEIF